MLRIKQSYVSSCLRLLASIIRTMQALFRGGSLGVSPSLTFARLHPDTRRHFRTKFGRILTNNVVLRPHENRFLHLHSDDPLATVLNE
jgi:hypothetical protein